MTEPRTAARMPAPDIDEVAVERAVHGDKTVTLNHDEAVESFGWLVVRGYGPTEVANRLGCSKKTVDRWFAGKSTPSARRDGKWAPTTGPAWARSS